MATDRSQAAVELGQLGTDSGRRLDGPAPYISSLKLPADLDVVIVMSLDRNGRPARLGEAVGCVADDLGRRNVVGSPPGAAR